MDDVTTPHPVPAARRSTRHRAPLPAVTGAIDSAPTPVRDDGATQERCPRCGALVPLRISWCSQCYADLSAPDPRSAAAPGPSAATGDRRDDDAPAPAAPSSGRLPAETVPEPVTETVGEPVAEPATAPAAGPAGDAVDGADADRDEELERLSQAMLAQLGTPARTGVRGLLDGGLSSPGMKVAVVAAGTVVVGGGGMALMYLVGSLV